MLKEAFVRGEFSRLYPVSLLLADPCVGTRAKNDKRLQTVPSIRSETLVDTNVGR